MLPSNFSTKTSRLSQFLFTLFVILGDHLLYLYALCISCVYVS